MALEAIPSQSTIFIIFGATGDLVYHKLAPALYNLFIGKSMPDNFSIIGIARSDLSNEEFKNKLLAGVNLFSRNGKAEEEVWNEFSKHLRYISADATNEEDYKLIIRKINNYQKQWGKDITLIFYLAVSPFLFPVLAKSIAGNGLKDMSQSVRIVIEKPFGHDFESAKSLNVLLEQLFE